MRRPAAGSRYRFQIDGGLLVPDPASRANPDDVHGASRVVDPLAFDWNDGHWRGRPWEEAVVYELHVGTFTPQGTFAGVESKLDYLRELGVTAIELMPIADFPGRRNWGYDGVLPFAPDASYGTPEDLKRLVQSAHGRGLMVFLDVVYNHFGPEGNYLHAYAPQFFTRRHHTPWGAAINFDGEDSRTVRDFFIHNALYWLEEYHIDGLRLDAVHAIADDSRPHILDRAGAGRARARRPQPRTCTWCSKTTPTRPATWERTRVPPAATTRSGTTTSIMRLHVLVTGERDGYYADYAERAARQPGPLPGRGLRLSGRAFALTATASRAARRAAGCARVHSCRSCRTTTRSATAPSASASAGSVRRSGSRPRSRSCCSRRSRRCCSWARNGRAREPFPFFCDFEPDLARQGHRRTARRVRALRPLPRRDRTPAHPRPQRAHHVRFGTAGLGCPDAAPSTRSGSRCIARCSTCAHARSLRGCAGLPRAPASQSADGLLAVRWTLGDGSHLHLTANLQDAARTRVELPVGRLLYATSENLGNALTGSALPAWAVVWTLTDPRSRGTAWLT